VGYETIKSIKKKIEEKIKKTLFYLILKNSCSRFVHRHLEISNYITTWF